MRYALIVFWMLFCSATSVMSQVNIGIGISLTSGSIGIHVPLFPQLVQVPGYPVYYAPRLNWNFFFYDGMYWVYLSDNWYVSSWYNGPWRLVVPEFAPLFVLRIPVRYYRAPPAYFRGWPSNSPPRWGEHWGHEWERRHSGWDKWDRRFAPAPAPLPVYQRQYSGDRYPQMQQQPHLHNQNYRYQPRDALVQQHYQQQALQGGPEPLPQEQLDAPRVRSPRQQDIQRSNTPPKIQQGRPDTPHAQPPQRAASQAIRRGQGQEKDRTREEEQGKGRNR